MSINIKKTSMVASNGVKILVHGESGAGKTTLIRTLPHPLILSAENGLLSIMDADLDYVEVKSYDEVWEAVEYAVANGYQSVAIDSMSELAEAHLRTLIEANPTDTRKAYGDLAKDSKAFLVALRDSCPGVNLYVICKTEKDKDNDGKLIYAPSLPGNATTSMVPYIFDEVFALIAAPNEDGTVERMLLTSNNGKYIAKDRSGRLDVWEPADLGAIIRKIGGTR